MSYTNFFTNLALSCETRSRFQYLYEHQLQEVDAVPVDCERYTELKAEANKIWLAELELRKQRVTCVMLKDKHLWALQGHVKGQRELSILECIRQAHVLGSHDAAKEMAINWMDLVLVRK